MNNHSCNLYTTPIYYITLIKWFWNVTTVVENCKGCEDPLNSLSHLTTKDDNHKHAAQQNQLTSSRLPTKNCFFYTSEWLVGWSSIFSRNEAWILPISPGSGASLRGVLPSLSTASGSAPLKIIVLDQT